MCEDEEHSLRIEEIQDVVQRDAEDMQCNDMLIEESSTASSTAIARDTQNDNISTNDSKKRKTTEPEGKDTKINAPNPPKRVRRSTEETAKLKSEKHQHPDLFCSKKMCYNYRNSNSKQCGHCLELARKNNAKSRQR